MKLYIDSADSRSWTLPAGSPRVTGVTTNPTLVHQAGLPVSLAGYKRLIAAAADHGFAELMLQVVSADADENSRLAGQISEDAHARGLKVTMKLPCDPRWDAALQAIQALGMPTLLTGLSNPIQLMWAIEKRAHWVAPYVGRLDAAGRDVWALMRACVEAQGTGPGLLAASIKSADVLAQLMGMGAHAVTLRPEFIASLCVDEVTLSAISQFERDIADSQPIRSIT
jgi:transaldolase